jgi:hypothetical protein
MPIGMVPSAALFESEGATVTSVTADDEVQTALAANTNRKGALLYNDCDKACYIKLGSGASSTSFSAKIAPNDSMNIAGYFNVGALRVYTGAITVIWDATPTGALRITELT